MEPQNGLLGNCHLGKMIIGIQCSNWTEYKTSYKILSDGFRTENRCFSSLYIVFRPNITIKVRNFSKKFVIKIFQHTHFQRIIFISSKKSSDRGS